MIGKSTIETDRYQSAGRSDPKNNIGRIRAYWNTHIHDLKITRHPIGTREFFTELAAYRFEKLAYLPRVVAFPAYKGRQLLEIGCGIGTDLVRFAEQGAHVTGVDLAQEAIRLAKENFAQQNVNGDLCIMNGESLQFKDDTFDVVYAHGVLQYTCEGERMINEIQRVLKPGGEAILMVYNRYSWLSLLSKLSRVELEHEDAPFFRKHSLRELRNMLRSFSKIEIIPERFPVKTRLHHGLKATVYNTVFVSAFNLIPKSITRPLGWHLMAKAIK